MKIKSFELENVKKVKAVTVEPLEKGLTVLGGNNNQGKTTVLDAICFALGGEKYRPSNLKRDDSVAEPYIRLTLSNGLVVERKGKNATLSVTDPSGLKAGQKLLDSFIEQFSLDLPKFLNSSAAEKAKTLLKIIGIGDILQKLDKEEQQIYNERHGIGIIADRKKKFSEECKFFHDVPEVPITATELIERQQGILARNAESDRACREYDSVIKDIARKNDEIKTIQMQLAKAQQEAEDLQAKAKKQANLPLSKYESTEELERELSKVEETNAKVRTNLDKKKAVEDALEMTKEYEELSSKIVGIREKRKKLLDGAKMPLPEMSIEEGELTLHGKKWDCMSGSEHLIAATAIVSSLNPDCGFVLLDKLEQLDKTSLEEFGRWLEGKNLQAIATRVSTGDECSIIIEDGMVIRDNQKMDDEEEGF
jgi:predicted ATP-dependent endonuclease of OLD family